MSTSIKINSKIASLCKKHSRYFENLDCFDDYFWFYVSSMKYKERNEFIKSLWKIINTYYDPQFNKYFVHMINLLIRDRRFDSFVDIVKSGNFLKFKKIFIKCMDLFFYAGDCDYFFNWIYDELVNDSFFELFDLFDLNDGLDVRKIFFIRGLTDDFCLKSKDEFLNFLYNFHKNKDIFSDDFVITEDNFYDIIFPAIGCDGDRVLKRLLEESNSLSTYYLFMIKKNYPDIYKYLDEEYVFNVVNELNYFSDNLMLHSNGSGFYIYGKYFDFGDKFLFFDALFFERLYSLIVDFYSFMSEIIKRRIRLVGVVYALDDETGCISLFDDYLDNFSFRDYFNEIINKSMCLFKEDFFYYKKFDLDFSVFCRGILFMGIFAFLLSKFVTFSMPVDLFCRIISKLKRDFYYDGKNGNNVKKIYLYYELFYPGKFYTSFKGFDLIKDKLETLFNSERYLVKAHRDSLNIRVE